MQRKLVYSGGIRMCGGFAVLFDVLWGPSSSGLFSSAFNEGPHFHCVCCRALSLSFFPPSFPPFPALGEICPLYPLAAAALGHSPGAQSQVGPLPLFCLPCPARCSFSDSWTGFLGEILFPWRHLSSHSGRQSNVGKGLEPFGD